MCHSSILINRINNVHCKVLSMVYCGKKASFKDLLQKYKALSIHIKHSHYLAVEIDRVKKYYVPNINEWSFYFIRKQDLWISGGMYLANRNKHTADFGIDTISSLGPKPWKIISGKIKDASTESVFKSKIKS